MSGASYSSEGYHRACLPPELKQEHGDGIIICCDDFHIDGDHDEQEHDDQVITSFQRHIDNVGALGDNEPPIVMRWDEALPWVTRKVDALDMCLEYFTLVFCVITSSLLKKRDYADAALIKFIEDTKKEDRFIPVFESRAKKQELHRMKRNDVQNINNSLLPALYNTRNPLYLDDPKFSTHLEKLLECHLCYKINRKKKQQRDIDLEIQKMQQSDLSIDNSLSGISLALSDIPGASGGYNPISPVPGQPIVDFPYGPKSNLHFPISAHALRQAPHEYGEQSEICESIQPDVVTGSLPSLSSERSFHITYKDVQFHHSDLQCAPPTDAPFEQHGQTQHHDHAARYAQRGENVPEPNGFKQHMQPQPHSETYVQPGHCSQVSPVQQNVNDQSGLILSNNDANFQSEAFGYSEAQFPHKAMVTHGLQAEPYPINGAYSTSQLGSGIQNYREANHMQPQSKSNKSDFQNHRSEVSTDMNANEQSEQCATNDAKNHPVNTNRSHARSSADISSADSADSCEKENNNLTRGVIDDKSNETEAAVVQRRENWWSDLAALFDGLLI